MDCGLFGEAGCRHRLEEGRSFEVAQDLAYRMVKKRIDCRSVAGQECLWTAKAERGTSLAVSHTYPSTPSWGRVRWTVLRHAVHRHSINYMDRQVIAILKPTLDTASAWTEVSYGYIVDAFQIGLRDRPAGLPGG